MYINTSLKHIIELMVVITKSKLLFFVVLILFLFSATAEEIKLKDDEAIIVINMKIKGSYTTSKTMARPTLKFKKINSKDQFSAMYQKKPQLLVAKSGRYYFKTIEWKQFVYNGLGFNSIPEPKYMNDTISIKAGTVTYIGDWILDYDVIEPKIDLDIVGAKTVTTFRIYPEYNEETVLDVLPDNTWLKEYPLCIATDKGKTMELSWE